MDEQGTALEPEQSEEVSEDRYAKPDLESNAGYQLGSGSRSGFKFDIKGGTTNFLKSNRKKFFIAGGGFGALAGLMVILFFLLLFKNIHIKNLFIDYEFAKFNRGFRNRLEKSITEADAKGSADSTVADGATPEENLAAANAAEIEKLKGNPDATNEAVREAEGLDAGSAGSGGVINPELGIDTSIADESGKSNDQIAKDTQKSISDELSKGDAPKDSPSPAAKDAADEATTAIESGASADGVTQAAVKGFSRGLNSLFSKITGPFIFATLGCIARDIYVSSYHVVAQLKFAGLARAGATQSKYADCQIQGKCSLTQIGTVGAMYDNSKESFVQSAAYKRATNQPVTQYDLDHNDLNTNLRPSQQLGGSTAGIIGSALAIGDKVNTGLNSIPLLKLGCGTILQPSTQVIFAAASVGTVILGVVTDTVDFGFGTVAQAAAFTGAQIFATKAGQALALDAALHYGGLYFKQHFSPIQQGNVTGAGYKALATDSCRVNGCRPLTAQENERVALSIQADAIKQSRNQSLAYRFFSPKNPYSTFGLLADRTPSSPSATMGVISRFFATALSPQKLLQSFSTLFNPSRLAYAANVESNTYGIPDYGFTDAELDTWGVVENSRWVRSNISPTKRDEFDKCFSAPMGDILADNGGIGSKCNNLETQSTVAFNAANNIRLASTGTVIAPTADGIAFAHYRIFKLDQRVTRDLVLLYNHQDGSSNGGSISTSATTTLPSGSAQQLAQQLISNPKVDKTGRLVLQDLQSTSQGQPASAGAPLSQTLLALLVALSNGHSYQITALESGGTGHATSSRHYTGDAVDIDLLDGQPVTGRNPASITIINTLAPLMPQGGAFGQAQCGTTPNLPSGINTFNDSCGHLHIEVPVGSP
ncbi:MAG TPA: hypothetical protein VLE72_02725 [Candidatus Saccharimonadales bacterium]|nr:hypothetical protein [Candidatus Saccharimonadales bacterium]